MNDFQNLNYKKRECKKRIDLIIPPGTHAPHGYPLSVWTKKVKGANPSTPSRSPEAASAESRATGMCSTGESGEGYLTSCLVGFMLLFYKAISILLTDS